MARTRDFKAYLIDIEGVLVRDKAYVPVEGSVDWFNGLGDRGIAKVLVSNNTTHTPDELAARLREVGFQVSETELVSALGIGAELLSRRGAARLLWLGDARLGDWWRAQGFELVEAGPCDAVVLGLNTDLETADLDRALPSLTDHDAELVALHRNIFYLDATGRRRFGPGFYAAALETAAAGETLVVGKPDERIYRRALEIVGVEPRQALFISDEPIADLITAKRLGMGTAFVLSGKYGNHAILGRMDQEDWPRIIADRPSNLDT